MASSTVSAPHSPQPVRPVRLRRRCSSSREALRGDADADFDRILRPARLRSDWISPALRDQAFAHRESDGVVLEIGGRGQHHDVRHAVIDERDRHLFGDAIRRVLGAPALPALDGDFDARVALRRGSACVLRRAHLAMRRGMLRTFTTCTAVTLYSGQLVAQSEFSVVTTFAPVSGKWNVV